MQIHGPAIFSAYFAKPLEESLSLKEKILWVFQVQI